MRWQALFSDLEAQLEARSAAEFDGEVADRTRREGALVRMSDRLRAADGQPVAVQVVGSGTVHGRVLDAGVDWLLLAEAAGREVLIPSAAVLGVTGLGGRTAPPGSEGEVGRRLNLRWALRGLARDRTGLALFLRDGSMLAGTLDRVGADHVDLAEHAAGEARRAGAVRQVRLIPFTALSMLRAN